MIRKFVLRCVCSFLLIAAYQYSATLVLAAEETLLINASPFKISLAMPDGRTRIGKGSRIRVIVSMENTGKEPISIPGSCVFLDYAFVVTNSRNQPLSLTTEGTRLTDRSKKICARKNTVLETKQVGHATLEISDLFDMTMPDEYSISVTRKARDAKGSVIVAKSQPLKIVVE